MDRKYINDKKLLGWSVLASPPTGSIVKLGDEQLRYQASPDQPLQGPLAAIIVLVVHTEDAFVEIEEELAAEDKLPSFTTKIASD